MADQKDDRAEALDPVRRNFLVGGAVGAAASIGFVADADAKTTHRHPAAAAEPASAVHRHAARQGAFLNDDDYATVVALTERLMPGAPGKPGATDADVANYIDLALSGAYLDQQYFYRQGLASLEAYCDATYKNSFVYLKAVQQDEVLHALEDGKAPQFSWPSAREFFERLRLHTIEGMFADPVYGGNKDFAGWRLVGFPGAQATFTEADMRSDKAFTRAPIVGLQQSVKTGRRG